jgi:predicted MPP superfamily phosphohydrolase
MIYFIADFGHFTNYGKLSLLLLKSLLIKEQPKFVLFGGDNFYPVGMNKKNKDFYEQEFNTYFDKKAYNMYGILGNHDYMGNINYQIKNNNIFNMENKYYIIKYKNYDLYMIDTMILSPYMDGYQNMIYNNLDSNQDINKVLKDETYKQLIWLNKKLEVTKKENRIPILFGHYPIYSNGAYKNHNNNNKLFELLLPLFLRYQIPLYVSGHDHIAQVAEHNIHDLKSQYDTCMNIDPITYNLNDYLNDQFNDPDNNYKLTTVISGSSVDLYTVTNMYNNSDSLVKYFNDRVNMVLKLELETDSIILSLIENNIIDNNSTLKYTHIINN